MAGPKSEYEMADSTLPSFHNDIGVDKIEIGTRKFQCIGAKPPFDHPHIYLDMGDENEIVCPYCSTLYRHNSSLKTNQAEPAECTC